MNNVLEDFKKIASLTDGNLFTPLSDEFAIKYRNDEDAYSQIYTYVLNYISSSRPSRQNKDKTLCVFVTFASNCGKYGVLDSIKGTVQ